MEFAFSQQKPLVVGQKYLTECIWLNEDYVPILSYHIGDLSGEFHFHVDHRFDKIKIGPGEDTVFGVVCPVVIEIVPKICQRQFPEIKKAINSSNYEVLQDKMRNKKTNCKTCPHQNGNLNQVEATKYGDKLVKICPVHGLCWDVETGSLIHRTLQEA